MKKLIVLSLFFIAMLVYGLIISQYRPPIMVSELEPQNASGYYDYRGVTNSHTSINMGSLQPNEVIREAQAARLDFIFLTDLNFFGEYPVKSDYYENLLVFVGNIYSHLDSHFIYYSLNPPKFSGLGEVQVHLSDLLSKVHSSGQYSSQPPDQPEDFVVLEHPYKGGKNWRGELPPGLRGIETVNLKAVWRQAWENTRYSFFWSLFIYPFNSHFSLLRLFTHPEKEMNLWNELSSKRPTIGFVGNETTSRIIPVGRSWFRFPSYKTSFEIASNHVLLRSELTGDLEKDRRKIFNGLYRGQFYMSLDYLENPKGFVTFIRDRKSEYPLGSTLKYNEDMQLHIRLPQKPKVPFEVIIFRDGKPIQRSHSRVTEYQMKEAGTYRIVVRVIPTMPLPDGKKWIPWIYTNSFFVK